MVQVQANRNRKRVKRRNRKRKRKRNRKRNLVPVPVPVQDALNLAHVDLLNAQAVRAAKQEIGKRGKMVVSKSQLKFLWQMAAQKELIT